MSSEPLLQVRGLTVRFGPPERGAAVDGVSFDVAAGEAVGLLGESGCGKTTTGLALLGLVPPPGRIVAGSIRLRGRELVSLDERALERVRGAEVAAIFQEPGLALNPVLTVGAQVAEVLRAHRGWHRRRCRREAEALLEEVRLSRMYSVYPHELSGGQRQRVLIAQAVACRPALLVADEPTAALDSILESEVLGLLRELKERLGLSLLLISHSLRTLAAIAVRVMVMYAGRIVEDGPLPSVFREPLHPYTRGLLLSVPRLHGERSGSGRLPSIPGQPPTPSARPAGCVFEPRCADRMEACRLRPPEETHPAPDRRVRCFKHGG